MFDVCDANWIKRCNWVIQTIVCFKCCGLSFTTCSKACCCIVVVSLMKKWICWENWSIDQLAGWWMWWAGWGFLGGIGYGFESGGFLGESFAGCSALSFRAGWACIISEPVTTTAHHALAPPSSSSSPLSLLPFATSEVCCYIVCCLKVSKSASPFLRKNLHQEKLSCRWCEVMMINHCYYKSTWT